MWMHDFQCPTCHNYYNRFWNSQWPGSMWCKRCGVECRYGETFWIENPGGQIEQAPRYDRQIVVKFTNTHNYGVVDESGTALDHKARARGLPSQVIALDPTQAPGLADKQTLATLTGSSRLYLVGHGLGASMQGVKAFDLAYLIVHTWGIRAIARITLVSCEVGQSSASVLDETFAQELHRLLGGMRVATLVAAYRRSVTVASAAFAQTKLRPDLEGKKLFHTDKDQFEWMANDGDKVKVVWYWDGTVQRSWTRSQDRSHRT